MNHVPIAIVGLGVRFPGAESVEALWTLLRDGVDATSETPPSRYDAAALYAPEPARGRVTSRRAGYLAHPDVFDAGFFNLSSAEAQALDPQQRLLMMCAVEALEDAGLPLERVAGTRAGVYVGAMRLDYAELLARRGLSALTPSAIYNYRSLLSGRLSYIFDLRGPSLVLDTACSSSLVAVHLACQGLRTGETELALAAGVNLKLMADEDVLLSQLRMLAPDGRCKFGDARADGFAPSEGVGVVVLKRLSDALRQGDRVRAVVLGSATSNDGATSGSLLAPSVEAHAQMLRWAYADAGVDPAQIDIIEAHGTGTPMIDPVEFRALAQVLGPGRDAERPCFVGSVKTNLGHAEGAAGIAALVKTVLCLEHRQVVPSLHHQTPNPHIPWSDLPLVVPTALRDLPDSGRPLLAGISGQGVSSANTHLVIGEAPAVSTALEADCKEHVFMASARSREALMELAQSYLAYLAPAGPGRRYTLRDICFSAATRRTRHPYAISLRADTHDALEAGLRAFVEGGPATQVELPSASDASAHYVPLPGHPWQLERYWISSDDQ